jgi:hypothetical protein
LSKQQTDYQDILIQQMHDEARKLLQEGLADDAIVGKMKNQFSIDSFYAETILDNIYAEKENRVAFFKHLAYGLTMIIAGAWMTYRSYVLSIEMGIVPTLILWGLVVSGISVLIRGFILFRK